MENTCKKCNETKDINLFVKNKKLIKGVCNTCNKCKYEMSKKYNVNILKVKVNQKKYRDKNIEKINIYNNHYYYNNILKVKKRKKEYYLNNSDKFLDNSKKYYSQNKEKCKEQSSIKNKEQTSELKIPYLITILKAKGFNKEQITAELIEVQRIIIKTKRLCKTSKI